MAKTQWNTMAKENRDAIVTFATTYAKRVVARDKFRKSVKNYEDIVATDRADLEKLALGNSDGVIRTMDAIKVSLETNLANIKPLKEAWEKSDEECKDIMAKVYKTVPETLYKAYCDRENNPSVYTKALTDWCKSMGVVLTDSTNRVLRETVGDKESDRAMLKDTSSMGLQNEKYDKYARMMCKKIAKLMGVTIEEQ